MPGGSAAETVQRAARATLAAGTARLRTLFAEEFETDDFWIGSEGVVDLERRLSRREERSTAAAKFFDEDAAAARATAADDEPPYITYEQGTTVVFGHEGDWLRLERKQRSLLNDPTFILDLLAERPLADAEPRGEEVVGDAACRRLGGRLDLRDAGLSDEEERAGPLYVEAWIDPSGRLARVAWRFPGTTRPRSPVRPREAPSWRTVELWEFGVPVEIEVPDARAPSRLNLRGRWRVKAAEFRGG
jgi:hypothetical protein